MRNIAGPKLVTVSLQCEVMVGAWGFGVEKVLCELGGDATYKKNLAVTFLASRPHAGVCAPAEDDRS